MSDRLRRSSAANERYEERLGVRIRECMEERGFEYPPIDYQPRPWWSAYEHPFGPWIAEEIVDGYRLPFGDYLPPDHATEDMTEKMSDAEREAWSAALIGPVPDARSSISVALVDGTEVPTGFDETFREGCRFAAQTQVLKTDYLTYEAYRQTIQDWSADLVESALADPDVEDALNRWSDCMADRGYGQFETPTDALTQFSFRPDREAASAEELRVASTDIECKSASNLVGVWFGTRERIEADFASKHELVLAEFDQIRKRAFG